MFLQMITFQFFYDRVTLCINAPWLFFSLNFVFMGLKILWQIFGQVVFIKKYWIWNINNFKTTTYPKSNSKLSTKHCPFLLKVLHCIVIISQSFTIKLKWPIVIYRGHFSITKTGETGIGDNTHLAFWAFWADMVTLPAPAAFLSTALMTTTATFCFMSWTAKWPRGRWPKNLSTHMDLLGIISEMTASPNFKNFGLSSSLFPEQ